MTEKKLPKKKQHCNFSSSSGVFWNASLLYFEVQSSLQWGPPTHCRETKEQNISSVSPLCCVVIYTHVQSPLCSLCHRRTGWQLVAIKSFQEELEEIFCKNLKTPTDVDLKHLKVRPNSVFWTLFVWVSAAEGSERVSAGGRDGGWSRPSHSQLSCCYSYKAFTQGKRRIQAHFRKTL